MSNTVLIIGTGKSKHMPKGSQWHEIPDMAEILVNNGSAVYEGTPLEEKEVIVMEEAIKDEKEKVDNVVVESKKEIKKPSTKKK